MLYVKHRTRRSGCSFVSYSPEFSAEEKFFADFARARRILDHLARKLRTQARPPNHRSTPVLSHEK
jgi:hypothetical protein